MKQLIIEFNDKDIGVNHQVICLNNEFDVKCYNELIDDINRWKANYKEPKRALNNLYLRLHCNAADKAFVNRLHRVWSKEKQMIKQLYNNLFNNFNV